MPFLCRAAVLHWNHYIVAPYVLSPCRLDGLFLGSFLAIARTETSTWQQVKSIAPYACAISLFTLLAADYQGHFYDFVAPANFPV